MKAFTTYQPYGFAIVAGLKGNETRPRRTYIRGRIAVHAGAAGFDAAIHIDNHPTIVVDGGRPEDLDEKLQQNNAALLSEFDERMRKQEDDERRVKYD